jgi:DNA-binding NarL/FixJ family response regulator
MIPQSKFSKTVPVRVVLIEDEREMREGLRVLLDFMPDFACVGAFRTMEEALHRIDRMEVNLILTDIGLPRMDGIEGTQILHEKFPELPIVVLTVHGEDSKIFRALCAGANGYLLKDTPPAKIIEALKGSLKYWG